MGITSIWISPHVDNVDVPVTYAGVANSGYHGYWARDSSARRSTSARSPTSSR